MSNFSERLKEYMQDLNLTQKDLGLGYGLPNATVSDFIHGKTMPTYQTLAKLIVAFNCSADFLLGIDEFPTDETLYGVLPFKDRFKHILSEKKVSQEKVRKDLQISASVIYKWVSGKNSPSATTLIRLAEYLECSVDYLIGRRR